MRDRAAGLLFALLLLFSAAAGLCETRVLLAACREFLTQPPLGFEASGNLQLLAAAFSSAGAAVSVEDGTLGGLRALRGAADRAFRDAKPGDLSVFYLCTHGLPDSRGGCTLVLSDGGREEPLSGGALFSLFSRVRGEKLLLIDACHSGALLPDAAGLGDDSLHLLASASPREAAWYYAGKAVESGALSYFSSAVCASLGLYGPPEADADADGEVTLTELYRHLFLALPSSTVQLSSADPDRCVLPCARRAPVSRGLSAFSFGSPLLPREAPRLFFSYTAEADVAAFYRLAEYAEGGWNWRGAALIPEPEMRAGRRQRVLELDADALASPYFILQIFASRGDSLLLCCERLFAFSRPGPGSASVRLASAARGTTRTAAVSADSPALCSLYWLQDGVRRPAFAEFLLRPSPDGENTLCLPVPPGKSPGLLLEAAGPEGRASCLIPQDPLPYEFRKDLPAI